MFRRHQNIHYSMLATDLYDVLKICGVHIDIEIWILPIPNISVLGSILIVNYMSKLSNLGCQQKVTTLSVTRT